MGAGRTCPKASPVIGKYMSPSRSIADLSVLSRWQQTGRLSDAYSP